MKMLPTLLAAAGLGVAAAAPLKQLGDFELADQNSVVRTYSFPKLKVTAMTVADRKGSEQLEPWIQKLYDRYGESIDIDGVADVSMIPGPLRGVVREVFRKRLTHPVMLDWSGTVVKRFGYRPGLANVYAIDRRGRIIEHLAGPWNPTAEREIFQAIDRAMIDSPAK